MNAFSSLLFFEVSHLFFSFLYASAIGGASKHDLFLWPLETNFEFCSFDSFLFFFSLFPFYCVLCLLSLPRFHQFRIVVKHSRLIVGQLLTTIFATNILKLGVVTQNILKSKGFFFLGTKFAWTLRASIIQTLVHFLLHYRLTNWHPILWKLKWSR